MSPSLGIFLENFSLENVHALSQVNLLQGRPLYREFLFLEFPVGENLELVMYPYWVFGYE